MRRAVLGIPSHRTPKPIEAVPKLLRQRPHVALQSLDPPLQLHNRPLLLRLLGSVARHQQPHQRVAHATRHLARLLGLDQRSVVDAQHLRRLHAALLAHQLPQELAQPLPPQLLRVLAPIAVAVRLTPVHAITSSPLRPVGGCPVGGSTPDCRSSTHCSLRCRRNPTCISATSTGTSPFTKVLAATAPAPRIHACLRSPRPQLVFLQLTQIPVHGYYIKTGPF